MVTKKDATRQRKIDSVVRNALERHGLLFKVMFIAFYHAILVVSVVLVVLEGAINHPSHQSSLDPSQLCKGHCRAVSSSAAMVLCVGRNQENRCVCYKWIIVLSIYLRSL